MEPYQLWYEQKKGTDSFTAYINIPLNHRFRITDVNVITKMIGVDGIACRSKVLMPETFTICSGPSYNHISDVKGLNGDKVLKLVFHNYVETNDDWHRIRTTVDFLSFGLTMQKIRTKLLSRNWGTVRNFT